MSKWLDKILDEASKAVKKWPKWMQRSEYRHPSGRIKSEKIISVPPMLSCEELKKLRNKSSENRKIKNDMMLGINVRIAACQIKCIDGDREGNLERIEVHCSN